MLQSLTIKNIALIDNLTINLCDGFNVLTGETGAGKSLIIDSLALLLGEKADRELISYGENFASVEAVFETDSNTVLDALERFGLERENTIIIYRKLSLDGRNECRVNGKSFTLSMLKQISSPLMDLHGQFQHQELLKEDCQLEILDDYGGIKIQNLKAKFEGELKELKSIQKQLSQFNFDSKEREKLIDLYNYQINEIEQANFVEGEEESLKDFRIKILNQEKIASTIARLESLFDDDNGLVSGVKRADYEFADLLKYIPEQEELSKRISSARYELEDIGECLQSIAEDLSFDEYAVSENEKRLDLLTLLKKKYGENIGEINAYLEKIKKEYDKLINSAEIIEKLEKEKEILIQKLRETAGELTAERKRVAEIFENQVKNELTELSMKSAKFCIKFDALDESNCLQSGFDKIEFLFTANAGQPLKPLSKVASGGEISRFMLAVKKIVASVDKIDTMIFDEIDTGISGETANVLAKKLADIGETHQVICVTHLAQVASFGKAHYLITKSENGGKTRTELKLLSGEDRINEIARIIGGVLSSFSINHAKLMIEDGEKY